MAQLTSAISEDNTRHEPYYQRGLAHHELGNYSGAINDFTRNISLVGETWGNLYLRGRAYDADGQTANALADYQASLALGPANGPANEMRQRIEQLG